ncbi:MAG: ester cyclase [Ferruginibacter sp.]
MKKFLFAPILMLGIFIISCNSNEGGMSATAKKNLDAMHGIQKAFEAKDFSKVGDYITEDAVDHAGMEGEIKGLANIKAEMAKMAGATENDKSTIVKEFADDDYVMSWGEYSSTMKVDMMGSKAGDKVTMSAIEVCKFKDGKVTEHWSFADMRDMMKMMSKGKPPMMNTPSDSTSMKKDTMK